VNFVGTSQYMAPECVHNKPTNKATDMWSTGCILYNLFIGLPPFRGASDYLIFKLSIEADFLKLDEFPKSMMPQDAKELIRRMVTKLPEERWTIDQVLESPFFDSVRDLKTMPAFDEDHQNLYKVVQDFILRGNVHKHCGLEEFKVHFETKVKP
jgi:serine/threonine protein kinase